MTPTKRAPIEAALKVAPPLVAGAEVPADVAGVVTEGPPPVAVVAMVLEPGAEGRGTGGTTTVLPPDGAGAGAGALPVGTEGVTAGGAGAFDTVGTEAGGVTWI